MGHTSEDYKKALKPLWFEAKGEILKMEVNSFLLEGQQGNFCCTGFS